MVLCKIFKKEVLVSLFFFATSIVFGDESEKLRPETTNFLAYMSTLLSEQVIGDADLHRLWDKLDGEKTLVNPIAEEKRLMSIQEHIAYEAMRKLLKDTLDHAFILGWIDDTLQKRGHDRKRRQETQEDTRVLFKQNTATIAAGDYHTCALLEDGQPQCWGYNNKGQSSVPKLNAPTAVQIAAGEAIFFGLILPVLEWLAFYAWNAVGT